MAKRKKKKSPLPRCRRMKRPQRLQSAKQWLKTLKGENVIRVYRKRYGVDWLCAVKELRMLNVALDTAYVQKREQTTEAQIKANRKRKLTKQKAAEEAEWNSKYPDSDENFCFIAGYTSGGIPYGITWEQAERGGLLEEQE